MHKKLYPLLGLTLLSCPLSFAQEQMAQDTIYNPSILYSASPKKYEIAGISVSGVKNYEDYVLIGFSGLSVGQQIVIPGDDITTAVRRFWKQGLFSDVSISVDKSVGNKVWLNIDLKQRPRISQINFQGVKKSEREDLEMQLGLVKGNQITPNMVDRAKKLIQRYFDEKGFKNATVQILQKDDLANENQMIVDILIDKKEKVKVNQIIIEGNEVMSDNKLQRVMKKTNEKGKLVNLFRAKKFVPEEFENDKQLIIDKYNELGYRDARIVKDSVWANDSKTVNVLLEIEEGKKYYVRDMKFVGNTIYASKFLQDVLQMQPGDVYNQKKIQDRIHTDEDGIGTLYMDQGYLFFNMDPVEVNVQNDSIDLEFRVYEGQPAKINRIRIEGNDRLYEHVVRRELYTKPGELFSKSALIRSARELAQTGHFNPETINPQPLPDPENGTVDILYALESKANDQIEFSAGWGQTGIIGKLSLKFTNFSMKNLLNPSSYKGIIPQGEGQTFTISAQTNARYYQSYSMSFFDPWFGGKRPNSLSVSAYYSKQTDISSNYYSNSMYNNYNYNSYYGNNYGYNNGYNNNSYEMAIDPDKSIQMIGATLGFGKRLNWPDDYFQFSAALSYQCYILKQWRYFPVENGTSNSVNLELNVTRNSIDNPIYTRRGSMFSLSGTVTPPYSLFKNTDHYKETDVYSEEKLKWLEYYKIKFAAKTFTPLTTNNNTLVLMTRADMGFLGYYNKYKRSPFESYYMGGDGMSGYSSSYITETIPLRGYENGAITDGYGNTVATTYARFVAELRYPLMLQPSSTIYGLAFVEAGNAWTEMKNFNPFSLKRSAGLGVRIFLPMIGMMGIDWAYGFDPVFGSRTNSGSNFHFVIGQEF
ncbi:MAG: outer membrane protein assembly factor BamA [Bacteroidales bacterium]